MSKENTKNPNESNNYVNQPQDEEEDLLWGGLQSQTIAIFYFVSNIQILREEKASAT